MKFNTQVAIATYVTFFVLAIAAVVLIVVLTRPSAGAAQPSVSPTTHVTPSPPLLTHVLLRDPTTHQCYQFDNLAPRLGAPEACTGFWIVNATPTYETLTFDGTTFETCIQPVTATGGFVRGTVGSGCTRVALHDNIITIPDANICITQTGGTLTWGTCDAAFAFDVVSV